VEDSFGVFSGVLIGYFRFCDAVENLCPWIDCLTGVYAIGACGKPERHPEINGESAAGFECLLDVHGRLFGVPREKYFLSARHNRMEPVESQPHVFQIII
jgi:hypothetical protein